MSYDLIVRGFSYVPLGQLREAFVSQPWWEIDGDGEGVLMTDTNTGVYITFSPAGRKTHELCFAINYNRPRFFAIESARTLATLARTFSWDVFDAQQRQTLTFEDSGIERLVDAWQTANDAQRWPVEGRPVIDRDTATRAWQWNYARPQVEDDLEMYVPRVFFVREPRALRAQTAIMWGNDVHALAIPDADFVLLRKGKVDELDADVIEPAALLEAAKGFVSRAPAHPQAALLAAPRFSLLLGAIGKARRGRFRGEIVAPDALVESVAAS